MKKNGRVVIETFTSRILAANPWKDPVTRRLPIYLPPSYDRAAKRRYPVLWCLAGFTGWGEAMLNLNLFAENLPQRLDRLIASGEMAEAIVAMPDCTTWLGGSQYVNSRTNGRYMDYLCDELVPFVDARYRTKAEPAHRGVLGKSSGGYGAITVTMRRPDVFGSLACHSGDMYFELGYKPDIGKAIVGLDRAGGTRRFIRTFRRKGELSKEDFSALNLLAMAAAYSPSAGRRQPAMDLPFDEKTGEIRPDVWARWLEWDPVHSVEAHATALRGLRLLYVDCGVRDEFNLHVGARILSARLKGLGVEHLHEEFDGGHFAISHRYDRSLPLLAKALK